jgi:YVTN family beta-propeller protein
MMNRNVVAGLWLVGLGLLGGCSGGGNTALTTVPTAHLAITLPARTVVAGTPIIFTVTALDATNAVVPTYVGTVHITASDPSAALPVDSTLTRGVGRFTVTFKTTGSQTITASDTVGDATSGISPAVSVTNPAPRVASLNPTQSYAGLPGFTMTVNGSNLVLGSVVQWNGGNRSTMFLSSSQVTAQISAADIATAGTAAVTIFNPAPGGGTSNASSFTITPCGGPLAPGSIAIDPTGKFAYVVVTLCPPSLYGLSAYAINPITGALTKTGPSVPTYDMGAVARNVTIDPSGKFAYVANQGDGDVDLGSVSEYSIDATTGALTFRGMAGTTLRAEGSFDPRWVTVHPSGRFAYTADATGMTHGVSMYKIDEARDGALTKISENVAGGFAISVVVDPTGKFAYATSDSNNVSMFSIDTSIGALVSVGTISTGTNPVALAVDPAGKFAYVTNSGSNDISMYSIDAATAALTSMGTVAAGTSPVSVAVDPAGKFAYVTNSGSNEISTYSINATTGALTLMGTIGTGLFPTSIAISLSGKFAYVTNSGSDNISVYGVDRNTGDLTLIGTTGS